MTHRMLAISVRQPWAWLIVNGYKPVENRGWATKYRGRVLIHASKGMTRGEYEDAFDVAQMAVRAGHAPAELLSRFPLFDDLDRGGIVGAADVVDCVSEMDSAWFCGPYGFVLRNAEVLPFRPCKGALGFFVPALPAGGGS